MLVSAATLLFAQTRKPSEEAIRNAPKIGEVRAFNKDFGFVVVNAGTKRAVKTRMRLGIRRSGKLVIIAIVETVTPETSTCGLLGYIPPTEPTTNAPRVGDEVIFYPPKS
ncbi:MAG: hypothetical protein AAGH89_08685 [Verrucomicrobiota bacterium]